MPNYVKYAKKEALLELFEEYSKQHMSLQKTVEVLLFRHVNVNWEFYESREFTASSAKAVIQTCAARLTELDFVHNEKLSKVQEHKLIGFSGRDLTGLGGFIAEFVWNVLLGYQQDPYSPHETLEALIADAVSSVQDKNNNYKGKPK